MSKLFAAVFAATFALGSLSYAAQTPGDGRRSKVVSETWTSVKSSAADRNQDRQPIPKACLDPGL